MTYGLTDAGFNRKTQSVIQDELITDFQALPGYGDIKTEPGSGFGQIIGVLGDQIAQLWELAEEVTLAAFRTTATGTSLNQALATVGQSRLGAAKSEAVVTLKSVETSIVSVPEGSLVSQSSNGVKWETTADAEIPAGTGAVLTALDVNNITYQSGTTTRYTFSGSPSLASVTVGDLLTVTSAANAVNNGDFFITAKNDGADWVEVTNSSKTSSSGDETGSAASADITNVATVDVDVQTIYSGPYSASIGSINTIVTPVTGWLAVTNAAVAVVGRDKETDAEARNRTESTLSISQGGTVEAIKARLLDEVAGVTYASYNENRTAATVGTLPPHSFEMIVVGGTDASVAALILDAKPASIQAAGTTTKSVTDPISGASVPISFSRVTAVPIYLIVNLTTDADYPTDGDDQVTQALVDYFETLEHGEDVLNYKLINAIAEIAGILTIAILQGTAPAPGASTNLTISASQIATLDSADVTVNS